MIKLEEYLYFDSLKNEDLNSIDKLYKEHYTVVNTLVTRNWGTQKEADQLYKETLVNFLCTIKKPSFSPIDSVQVYIHSIAFEKWQHHIFQTTRKKFLIAIPERLIEIEDEDFFDFEYLEESDKAAILIKQFSSSDQKILHDVYFQKKPNSIIKEETKLSLNDLHRQKQKLVNDLLRSVYPNNQNLNVALNIKVENQALIERYYRNSFIEGDFLLFDKLQKSDAGFLLNFDFFKIIRNAITIILKEKVEVKIENCHTKYLAG